MEQSVARCVQKKTQASSTVLWYGFYGFFSKKGKHDMSPPFLSWYVIGSGTNRKTLKRPPIRFEHSLVRLYVLCRIIIKQYPLGRWLCTKIQCEVGALWGGVEMTDPTGYLRLSLPLSSNISCFTDLQYFWRQGAPRPYNICRVTRLNAMSSLLAS